MSARCSQREMGGGGNAVSLSNLRVIDGLLFDVCSGKFHRVNKSATYIITALQAEYPIPKIVQMYARDFDITPTIAARDIEIFLNELVPR
jgi:hypothetical protein